ncbi:vacuolar iron transporter homolog 5-like isoform X2 [Coffea arabica]|uniref:Vacuolar iron transporter n=1 Tax=Coffea arabica TaxID=13443 RepID=A0ABM4V2E5_COFAR
MSIEPGSGNKLSVTATQEKVLQGMQRAQWLRAAILGANDGLLSTASMMLGIGAAKDDQESMIISGIAGALAGACSMAVGEFVSVTTQRDIEKSTIHKTCSDEPNRSPFVNLASESESSQGKLSPSMQSLPHILAPSRPPMMKVVVTDARAS